MYEVIFKVPIYAYRIKLVLCEDIEKYVVDNNLYDGDGKCKAMVLDFEELGEYDFESMVLFSNGNVKGGLIAHEAFHLLCLIMRSRGFILNEASEECCAYLLEWIYIALVQNLIKLKQQRDGNTSTSEAI